MVAGFGLQQLQADAAESTGCFAYLLLVEWFMLIGSRMPDSTTKTIATWGK